MIILKGKKIPFPARKVLKCHNGSCKCRFQLEDEDFKKLKNSSTIDGGIGLVITSCPKCGKDVVVA